MKRALYLTAFLVFLIDQAIKYYVVQVLNLKTTLSIDVIDPILNLRMAWNRGINFGLLAQNSDAARWVLIWVAVFVVLFVLYWMRFDPPGRKGHIAAGFLVGGAIGNIVDRFVYGAVADFINMSCCGFQNPYSFNVADISIFLGVAGLILWTGHNSQTDENAP